MKAILGLGVLVGLLVIWRKPAAAATLAAEDSSPLGGATDPAAQLDVTNATTQEQNTITIGNESDTEIGGDLYLGGTGVGLDSGGGEDSDLSTVQNTLTVGNGSVVHFGSGRRPARSSDFEDFWSSNTSLQINDASRGGAVWLGHLFVNPFDFEENFTEGSNQYARFTPPRSGANYNTIRAAWHSFFGNSVAFPGDPIT